MANLVGGQQLGNYHVIRLLGQGAFAEVYLGEHIHLGTQVAIKVLQGRIKQEDVDNFIQEARNIAKLRHPHIVRVLEFGLDNNFPFLIMDYAAHGTLRQRHPKGSRLPVATILPYVKQIAVALQYAHDQKLVHRDVKPENMLVDANNDIWLSDFGIATLTRSYLQSLQDIAGTVLYMAPEQIQGEPRRASDQYSLGIVVYEWLSGSSPFNGSAIEIVTQHLMTPPPPLNQKVPAISPTVEQVVLKALAKDPKKRFASVQGFATALEEAWKAEKQAEEIKKGNREREAEKKWSHKKLAGLFLALALVLALVIGSVVLFPLATSKKGASRTITPTPSQGTKPVTPTPNILLTAEAGLLDYHDALNSSSTSTQKAYWQSVGTNNSRCFFAPDGYHVLITATPEAICHEKGKSYQDFTISIDMALDGRGSGGLLFRDQDLIRGNGAYFFEVNSGGQYEITTISAINKHLHGWTSSSAIHQGNKVQNTLQVIASGYLLIFYINGVYLTRVTDETFLYGGISLACFHSGEAIFSNLYVYLPG